MTAPDPVDDAAVELTTICPVCGRTGWCCAEVDRLRSQTAEARASLEREREMHRGRIQAARDMLDQRDEAVARAEKAERERDLLRSELDRVAAGLPPEDR